MSNKHLSNRPYTLEAPEGAESWVYEQPSGLEVYFRLPGQGIWEVIVPWKKIRAALKRKEA